MKTKSIFVAALVLSCLLAAGAGGCGGGGGGGGLVVGNISGPATVSENATANYSVSPSGDSGYTYQWTVNPATAGTFTNGTTATATFTPNAVTADTSVQIRVEVNSTNYGPVIASLTITIEEGGLGVSSISGPATVNENATANYSVTASGDSGYTYQWTVVPGTAGNLTNDTTDTVTFDPNLVAADTSATIQVEVNSTNFGPVTATLNITILDDVVTGDGWAVTWGGTLTEHARDVIVASSGDLYVTGYFSGGPVDFDPGPGVDNHWSGAGSADPYLSKFDSDGNFDWAITWGGAGSDSAYAVAEDSTGDVIVVGAFQGANVNFDPAGWVPVTAACAQDAFAAKYDTDGNFEWVVSWGSTNAGGSVIAQDVRIDSADNFYVGGTYVDELDADPSAGTDLHPQIGSADIFLSKFDSSAGHMWTAHWGSVNFDMISAIDIDSSGDVWAVGYFAETTDFDPGPGVTTTPFEGTIDCFLNHLDTNGNFQWVRAWGGTNSDLPLGLALDSTGAAYVTGWFIDTVDFDPGAGSSSHTSDSGSPDAFLNMFDASGNFQDVLVWGGSDPDFADGIEVDSSGNINVTGTIFGPVDLDPGAGADVHTPAGGGFVDIFISRFDSGLNYQWGRDWGAAGVVDQSLELTLDGSGSIYTCGYFGGTIDFDPGVGTDNHSVVGGYDAWLMKLLPNGDW